MEEQETEEQEIIPLTGFEPDNEPEIRLMTDGSVYLVFNFFPPLSFDMSGPDIDQFANELSAFLSTQTIHEDREFFLVQYPKADTVEKLKLFVESYRGRKGYGSLGVSPPPIDPDLPAGFGLRWSERH